MVGGWLGTGVLSLLAPMWDEIRTTYVISDSDFQKAVALTWLGFTYLSVHFRSRRLCSRSLAKAP